MSASPRKSLTLKDKSRTATPVLLSKLSLGGVAAIGHGSATPPPRRPGELPGETLPSPARISGSQSARIPDSFDRLANVYRPKGLKLKYAPSRDRITDVVPGQADPSRAWKPRPKLVLGSLPPVRAQTIEEETKPSNEAGLIDMLPRGDSRLNLEQMPDTPKGAAVPSTAEKYKIEPEKDASIYPAPDDSGDNNSSSETDALAKVVAEARAQVETQSPLEAKVLVENPQYGSDEEDEEYVELPAKKKQKKCYRSPWFIISTILFLGGVAGLIIWLMSGDGDSEDLAAETMPPESSAAFTFSPSPSASPSASASATLSQIFEAISQSVSATISASPSPSATLSRILESLSASITSSMSATSSPSPSATMSALESLSSSITRSITATATASPSPSATATLSQIIASLTSTSSASASITASASATPSASVILVPFMQFMDAVSTALNIPFDEVALPFIDIEGFLIVADVSERIGTLIVELGPELVNDDTINDMPGDLTRVAVNTWTATGVDADLEQYANEVPAFIADPGDGSDICTTIRMLLQADGREDEHEFTICAPD